MKYVPLTYPTLVRETTASRQFQLYGDRNDPAYKDISPRDGVDDARARWLHALGVRFAPLMVRNTAYAPTDFRAFTRRPSFAINVDTWDLARDDAALLEHSTIELADLAGDPCREPDAGDGGDCRLLRLVREFGPGRDPKYLFFQSQREGGDPNRSVYWRSADFIADLRQPRVTPSDR